MLQKATKEVFKQAGLKHQVKRFPNKGWLAALAGSQTLSHAAFAAESALFNQHRHYMKADDIELQLNMSADLQRKLTEAMDQVAACLADCTTLLHRAGESLFQLARDQTEAAIRLHKQATNTDTGELLSHSALKVWL